ncbi:Uncharacterised protein [Mycobacteroides abscessus subsp. abscessus]|nr:Uncharacterised protein [Mycobacteroides abscessus subsp. abscessus]
MTFDVAPSAAAKGSTVPSLRNESWLRVLSSVLVAAAAAPMIAGLVRAGRPSGVYAPSIAMSERFRNRYA